MDFMIQGEYKFQGELVLFLSIQIGGALVHCFVYFTLYACILSTCIMRSFEFSP